MNQPFQQHPGFDGPESQGPTWNTHESFQQKGSSERAAIAGLELKVAAAFTTERSGQVNIREAAEVTTEIAEISRDMTSIRNLRSEALTQAADYAGVS